MTPDERELHRILWAGLHGSVPVHIRDELITRFLDILRVEGFHLVSTPMLESHIDLVTGSSVQMKLAIDGRPVSVSWMPKVEETVEENERLRRESMRELGRNVLIELGLWNKETDLPVAWTVPEGGDEYAAALAEGSGPKKAVGGSEDGG